VDEAEISLEFSFISFQLSCSRVAVALRRWTKDLMVMAGIELGLLIKKINQIVFMKSAGTPLPYLTAACSGRKFLHFTRRSTSRSIKAD
jgi:hypothetical protein